MRGKKPTVNQCKFMQKNGVNSAEWLVAKDTSTEMLLVYRNDHSIKKTIHKGEEKHD